MSAIIEVEGLRKEYVSLRRHRTVAVDGLDITVPDGGVFGFLGPNGAGKTTTIRCLLGLVRPSKGSVRMFGQESTSATLPQTLRKVGALVESPALFPTISGRKNLKLLASLYGIGERTITSVLNKVGLSDREDDLVKSYSLGMRQRLGIAAALLKDPQLLILDEPANGLDPAGIREMRELLRNLGGEGRTVFVSSHILNEIELMCDEVAILKRGRCIASGPVSTILDSTAQPRQLIIGVHDIANALSVLHASGIDATVVGERISVSTDAPDARRINQLLGEAGYWLHELRPHDQNLEDIFLELTTDQKDAS